MNAGDQAQDEVLHMNREFDAPVEKLVEAFTNPAVMTQWWGPEGMQVYRCEVDLQPGGAWCVGLLGADGEPRDVSGRFTQVEDRAIAFTWRWHYEGASDVETLVSIAFEHISDLRSAIHLTQQTFASVADRDNHKGGWTSSFGCLDNYLKDNR